MSLALPGIHRGRRSRPLRPRIDLMLTLLLLAVVLHHTRRAAPTLILVAATFVTTTVSAADTVRIELNNGRAFTGQVDPRTTSDQLWLRFSKGRIVIRRPFAWDQLV